MKKSTRRADSATAEVRARPRTSASAAHSPTSLSQLKEQAEGLRRAQEMASLAHVVTAPDGSFESWSHTLPRLLGIPPKAVVDSTRRWLELLHPDDREHFRSRALQARADRRRTEVEYRLWRGDKTWIHLRQVMEPIPGAPDERGRLRWFNTIQDVTASRQAELRIKRLNRIHAMLSSINALVVRVGNREELYREACRIAVEHGGYRMAWLGIANPERTRVVPMAWAGDIGDYLQHVPLGMAKGADDFGLAGRACTGLAPIFSQDAQRDGRAPLRREAAARGFGSLATLPLVRKGRAAGVLALYALEAGHFDEEEMRLLRQLAEDVAFSLDHIEKSEKAEYLAFYDPLTELANRNLFQERLAAQLAAASGASGRCGLLLLDLEHFKTINDTFGRQAGDALLKRVAERVTALVPRLHVSRVGADQFAVLVPDVRDLEALLAAVEQRAKDFFDAPYAVGNLEVSIAGRFGIALFPEHGADAEALFRSAEAALKKAKALGERWLVFEEGMLERVAERLALESRLRRALELEQFVLFYQPKVSLETRRITGAEALIRWREPERGLVSPAEFIPMLEQTGLILPVGSWAIRRAAEDRRALLERGLPAPRIAVNVSAIQLRQRRFVAMVEEAIGGDGQGIDLEITESLLVDDVLATIDKLKRLREQGAELAIDDFGTGYSSLGYLAKLPVHALKIDRSFVSLMHSDPDAMTMVQTMISLAHAMRLKVVAEGVETEEQAKMLRLVRCDEMQGYLFSRPVPLEEFAALLQKSG